MNASLIVSRRALAVFLVAALGAVLLFSYLPGASAQEGVAFPVKELGGCDSKEACHAYCEESAHMAACLDFAEKNGLMSERELSDARKFMAAGGKGPGGCTTKDSCEAFCNNVSNISACIAFAEKSGMMSGDELEEAKKIVKALESGVAFPGGCRSKEECDAYCGGSNPSHMKECITFARAAGFMSDEEAREVDKVLSALEKGVPPPKCRGDEECAVYCSQPENIEGCVAFATAAGMITEAEASMMRKTGGRGPGGCVGKACETFCNDPKNQEVCTQFAIDNGLMSEEDLARMRERGGNAQEMLRQMPEAVRECLKAGIGEERFERFQTGGNSGDISGTLDNCFREFMSARTGEGEPPSGDRGEYGPPQGGYPPPESYSRPPVQEGGTPPPDDGSRTAPPPTDSFQEREGEPVSLSHGQAAAALLMIFFGMLR